MGYVLDRGNCLTESVMQEVLLFALQHNKPLALQTLFERHLKVSKFEVVSTFCYVSWARAQMAQKDPTIPKTDESDKKKYFLAAQQYYQLLKYYRQNLTHYMLIRRDFEHKSEQLTTSWPARLRGLFGSKDFRHKSMASRLEKLDRKFNKHNALCWSAGHPIPASLRRLILQYAIAERDHVHQELLRLFYFDRRALREALDSGLSVSSFSSKHWWLDEGAAGRDGVTKEQLDEMARKGTELKHLKEVILLEGIYNELLGPSFRYRIGIQGACFDLFLLCALGGRRKLAEQLWQQVECPVLTAITGVCLLRAAAKKIQQTDRLASLSMYEDADFFEKLAVQVYLAAQKEDPELAAHAISSSIGLWGGLQMLDIAIQSNSLEFVEQCCPEAMSQMFFGDLDSTNVSIMRIVLGLASFGILPAFFPSWIKFTSPPLTEATRRRTQRRARPRGYPFWPMHNELLAQNFAKAQDAERATRAKLREGAGLTQKEREKYRSIEKYLEFIDEAKDDGRVQGFIDDREVDRKVREFWDFTFTGWQRWGCFMSAPIVLFFFNIFVNFAATIFFSCWFVLTQLEPNRLKGESASVKDGGGVVTTEEAVMMVFFSSSLFKETFQALLAMTSGGSSETLWNLFFSRYLDKWDFLDLCAVFAFFVGFFLRIAQYDVELVVEETKYSTAWGFWCLAYAVALFCCWIRLLRVFYDGGLSTLIFISIAMFRYDVCQWLVIYFVLLFASIMLVIGVFDPSTVIENCDDEMDFSEHSSDMYLQCKWEYVFLRTIFQSFGELFLEDIRNIASAIILIVIFVILNVVMMNLLIAQMSATFGEIQAHSALPRLLERFHLNEEHMFRSVAAPPPFNVITTIFDIFAFFFVYYDSVQVTYPECTLFERLNLFMSRNRPFSPARWMGSGSETQNRHEDRWLQEQEAAEGRKSRKSVSALMERARCAVTDQAHAPDTLLGRVHQISEDIKFVQRMQINSALEGEPPPSLDNLLASARPAAKCSRRRYTALISLCCANLPYR